MKQDIIDKFALFTGGTGGIDSWLGNEAPREIFEVLDDIVNSPLTCSRMNQLLTLAHEAPISEAFFKYYWLTAPEHTYNVRKSPGFNSDWIDAFQIISLEQLYWGFYRFYVDALLFFGNVRTAYQVLRQKTQQELQSFFQSRRFNGHSLADRGPALELDPIVRDDRYLISEMACKSCDAPAGSESEIKRALIEAYRDHNRNGGGLVTVKQLLDGSYLKRNFPASQLQLHFSAEDMLEEQITTEEQLDIRIERVIEHFGKARTAALNNTNHYLSMVGDLDVYVATSMRTRDDFRAMAEFCENLFSDQRLMKMRIRYFDPTLSACSNHEDKGLIECLMVKCAKALMYYAGRSDSYGKDAEAAMALALGKPVIFYCDSIERANFYKEIHPLSRLINFQNGVAVGAMITTSIDSAKELVARVFEDNLEYELIQKRVGYLCLSEKISGCIVRLQTNDGLLRETFWNYYNDGRKQLA